MFQFCYGRVQLDVRVFGRSEVVTMVGAKRRAAVLCALLVTVAACGGQGAEESAQADPAAPGQVVAPTVPAGSGDTPVLSVSGVETVEKENQRRRRRPWQRWRRARRLVTTTTIGPDGPVATVKEDKPDQTIVFERPSTTEGKDDDTTTTGGNGSTTTEGDDKPSTTESGTSTSSGDTSTTQRRTSTTERSTSTSQRGTSTTQRRTTTTQGPTTTQRPDPDTGLWPIYTPQAGCREGSTVPLGQGSGAKNFEPLGSIWCFALTDPPARTAVIGANSWVDDFTTDSLMHSFEDRDLGYRVFDDAGQAPGTSQHWINQNHWMVDMKEGFTGGASIRPDRSFRFENGKIVVEGDFAASIPEYARDTWGEITITSAPAPTGEIADKSYAYGQFGGHWAVGCRLTGDRRPVCAVEGPEPNSPPSRGGCFAIPGKYRVLEISWFQNCGSSTMGGHPSTSPAWRRCVNDGPDMLCRDRFRMEVTKNSLTLYVNGVKYFEDAGWPAAHQLPDSFINGDVYVYQSNWQNRAGSRAYRYHWDHFAVNPPHGPEPSEWYGFTGFG